MQGMVKKKLCRMPVGRPGRAWPGDGIGWQIMDYPEYLFGSLYTVWMVLFAMIVVDLLYCRCYRILDRW